MLHAISQVLPLVFVFMIGYGLKRAKMLSSDDGSTLLKLIFYAGAPALVGLSILKVELDASLMWLGLLAPIVIITTMAVTFLLRRSWLRNTNSKTFGALLVGAAIMNTGFMLPFVERLYGAEGVARLAVIDAFNALFTFSLVYAVVVRLGNDKPDAHHIAKKLLLAPPLWALAAALLCRLAGLMPPVLVLDTLGIIAKLVSPVVLLALGLKFTPRIKQPRLLFVPLVLRFVLGGLIGAVFVKVLGLHGLTAKIALFASMAPIGFNSITFSELEGLDVAFAASQVSIALIVALVITPLVVQL